MSRDTNVVRRITCATPTRFVRVGWISFQPRGDVSFGLSDRTFISPDLKGRQNVWNVFNRVVAEFQIVSDFTALEKVKNPHFTFHPPIRFHLHSEDQKPSRDEALFSGICDVGMVLEQQGTMPWIRTITAPLSTLKSSGLNWSTVPLNDIPVKTLSEDVSIQIEIDFVKIEDVPAENGMSRWYFVSGDVGVRLTISQTYPSKATLGWFHSA